MAKAVTIKVKLVSSADTGFYYVAKKNSRTMTDKLVKKKYDPVPRKHPDFRESKIKEDSRKQLADSNGAFGSRFVYPLASPVSRIGSAPRRKTAARSAAAGKRQPNAIYAALTKGGSVGRTSANATWMIPAAKPTATPIRQASV